MSADDVEKVELLCTVADGLVILLAYLFWECGTGLLEQYDGLGRSVDCKVGMQIVDFWQLFYGDWLLACDLKKLGTLG